MEATEGLGGGSAKVLVHSKGLAGPIHASTHGLLGSINAQVVLVLPIPHNLNKICTAEINAGFLLSLPEHLLDDRLGGRSRGSRG